MIRHADMPGCRPPTNAERYRHWRAVRASLADYDVRIEAARMAAGLKWQSALLERDRCISSAGHRPIAGNNLREPGTGERQVD